MTSQIAIIGGGGWGTALAVIQSGANRNVRLWAFEPYLVETILATRENPIYLPGKRIPQSVLVTNEIEAALEGAAIVIVAVPSHVFRSVMDRMMPALNRDMIFVSAAKGIENGSLMRMSEVVIDAIGSKFAPKVAAISEPTFAPEVATDEPTATSGANVDPE